MGWVRNNLRFAQGLVHRVTSSHADAVFVSRSPGIDIQLSQMDYTSSIGLEHNHDILIDQLHYVSRFATVNKALLANVPSALQQEWPQFNRWTIIWTGKFNRKLQHRDQIAWESRWPWFLEFAHCLRLPVADLSSDARKKYWRIKVAQTSPYTFFDTLRLYNRNMKNMDMKCFFHQPLFHRSLSLGPSNSRHHLPLTFLSFSIGRSSGSSWCGSNSDRWLN